MLREQLKRLEVLHKGRRMQKVTFKVYYGWAKLNKVQKKEALTVIYVNDVVPPRINRDGMDGVTKYMKVAWVRDQTADEMSGAPNANKIYTSFSIFLDKYNGSLKGVLDENDRADMEQVSEIERDNIYKALERAYIDEHPGYKEKESEL